ncbi:MAG: acetate kinase [Bacteroidales bacterium]|nr:acetate kinase [Candidatus Cacconaster merdequi]
MIILVLNCGSSSLKYQVLDMKSNDNYTLKAKGLVERIGGPVGSVTHTVTGSDKYIVEKPVPDHAAGIKEVLDLLTSNEHGVLASLGELDAVGHRVAHGGEYFSESALITPQTEAKIEECSELAPLHQPANLLGIRAVRSLLPSIPQVAVFDTSFHQTMPQWAYLYSIPYEYYEKYKVRRYGFHGTSHKFVAAKAAKFAGLDINNSRIITCHLGNGSSITAVKDGKSIDTSMGFTPVEGVTMGTRSGNIDAGAVLFLQEKEGLDAAAMSNVLNKKSGLLGISGISSDCRDIQAAADQGSEIALTTQKVLGYGIKKYIGAYAAALNGVDMIVFTGGIGENSSSTRANACRGLEYLGVDFDEEANLRIHGVDAYLSKPESKVKVAVITTDEELVIAQDTMAIVNSK